MSADTASRYAARDFEREGRARKVLALSDAFLSALLASIHDDGSPLWSQATASAAVNEPSAGTKIDVRNRLRMLARINKEIGA